MPDASPFKPLTELSAALAAIVAAASPSLVQVRSRRSRASGFVWRPGLVVTAEEILAEEGGTEVILADGSCVPAEVAGRDETTDVALLRVQTGEAPAVTLEGAVPAVGSLVLSVGRGEEGATAAIGAAASIGPAWRSMRGGDLDARIELDLSLRRSAEGGLALDAFGRAFGMCVFGPGRRVLVIPASTILRVADVLERRGRMGRGYLGLGLQPVRLETGAGQGAMVMSVDGEGPGAEAGLRQGDVVTAFDGRAIETVAGLLRVLGPDSVGRQVRVTALRGGAPIEVALTIGERPDP